MSGTYRTTLVYVKDGHYGHGVNARNGAAEMKKLDRRMKRRQSARITRDALREHDDAAAMDMRDMMDLMSDYEGYDCDSLYDVNEDFNDEYWAGDYGNQPGDGGWNDPHDGYSWYYDDYHLERDFDFREELRCPAEKEAVQEGVSLGDVLARTRKEKGLD